MDKTYSKGFKLRFMANLHLIDLFEPYSSSHSVIRYVFV